MNFAFYLISGLAVAGALAAVLLKNTVHCALALTVAFAGIALLFLKLGAQFAGFAQILVYIGAVAILVVFAILLTKGSETPKDGVFSKTWLAGLVVAAGVFAVLGWAVLQTAPMYTRICANPANCASRLRYKKASPAKATVSASAQCTVFFSSTAASPPATVSTASR